MNNLPPKLGETDRERLNNLPPKLGETDRERLNNLPPKLIKKYLLDNNWVCQGKYKKSPKTVNNPKLGWIFSYFDGNIRHLCYLPSSKLAWNYSQLVEELLKILASIESLSVPEIINRIKGE
ncbi:MAG: hypothetical protein F6K40_32985 [Okeania sp. SIO3I5]|uniref:hypothetical protein n=1 Tax=Okeania sp. SIO3I5 TaxID=2607805 RepID=UPI0013BAC313|nr:hypothetical protein [Okeania sp. SIO3I5]NEQ40779.1 hypothetical protein [Okeania sp. SIO3I5]